MSGISKAPGTHPIEMSRRSTPASVNALSAPSRRRVVMAPLKRAQTIATRTPVAPDVPSRYSPARARRASVASGSNAVSLLDVIESLEKVTHPLALRSQVVDIEGRRTALEGHALDDVESESLEAAVLHGVVGHEAHGGDAEIHEDLRARAVLARVDRQTLFEVRVHRVAAVFLEGVGANLVREAYAAAFLSAQVDDHARALRGHLRQRHSQLRSAVATQRAQRVTRQALRVHAHQEIVHVLDVAVDERDVLLTVEHALEDVGQELTELGRK